MNNNKWIPLDRRVLPENILFGEYDFKYSLVENNRGAHKRIVKLRPSCDERLEILRVGYSVSYRPAEVEIKFTPGIVEVNTATAAQQLKEMSLPKVGWALLGKWPKDLLAGSYDFKYDTPNLAQGYTSNIERLPPFERREQILERYNRVYYRAHSDLPEQSSEEEKPLEEPPLKYTHDHRMNLYWQILDRYARITWVKVSQYVPEYKKYLFIYVDDDEIEQESWNVDAFETKQGVGCPPESED